MAKRLLVTVLAILMLTLQPIHVLAMEHVSTEPIIIDREKHETIQELMDLRCELLASDEDKSEEILIIDAQLRSLGVEELSAQEVAEKLGYPDVSVMATPAAKAGVTYLSERYVTVWNGERYEIQEITASPEKDAQNSPLKQRPLIYFQSVNPIAAAAMNVLEVVAEGAIDAVSEHVYKKTNYDISSRITFYKLFAGIIEDLKQTTMVNNVLASCYANVSFYERYVFVKYDGSADAGNQILAYCGNRASYTATFVTPVDIMIDGESFPNQNVATITETYKAGYYDNNTQYVCQVFWNYKHNGITDYTQRFWIRSISFTGIGDSEEKAYSPEVGAVWS